MDFRDQDATEANIGFTPDSPAGHDAISARKERNSEKFRFVDLFAGLGGFHLALGELGGRSVFAAEWDQELNALYERNFGLKPWGDLNLLKNPGLDVPDHEVLTAGFPCQPFSKAGEQLGFEHTLQGRLFYKVLEILEAKRPKRFILENVPNILRHRKGETLQEINTRLHELGYDVRHTRLSPHQFGVPQIRERAYFVGSLDDLDQFEWPIPENLPTDIRDVLDSNPTDLRPVPAQTLAAIDAWDDFLRSSPPGLKMPSFPIWSMEFGASYPYEEATPAALIAELGPESLYRYRGSFGRPLRGMDEESLLQSIPSHARRLEYQFPRWKTRFIRQNREFYEENRAWIDPWLKRSKLRQMPSSLQKFEWNAQGEERRIENFVIQTRASGVRVKRTHTAPSLVAMTHTQVPILGWDRRYMTPRECARLQSLDAIVLPNNYLKAYKALGNAVNSKVVRELARPLLRGL